MSTAAWAAVAAHSIRCLCGRDLPMPPPYGQTVCPDCATRYGVSVIIHEERVIGHCPNGHPRYDHMRINGQCPTCAIAEALGVPA